MRLKNRIPVFIIVLLCLLWSAPGLVLLLKDSFYNTVEIHDDNDGQVIGTPAPNSGGVVNGQDSGPKKDFSFPIEVFSGEYIPALETGSKRLDFDYSVYDDFEDPLYYGSYNSQKWQVVEGNPNALTQKDGYLSTTLSTDGVQFFASNPPEGFRSFEVFFMTNQTLSPTDGLFLELIVNDSPTEFYCALQSYESSMSINCNLFVENGRQVHSEGFPFRPGDKSVMRVDYDAEEGVFIFSINDVTVFKAALTPEEKTQVNAAGFTPKITIRTSSANQIQIDQVNLGRVGIDQQAASEFTPPPVVDSLNHSDLFSFDDFSDPSYDSIYNSGKWKAFGHNGYQVVQKDGGFLWESGDGNWGHLLINQLKPLSSSQINSVQLDIQPLQIPTDDRVKFMLSFTSDEGSGYYRSYYTCEIRFQKEGGEYQCGFCQMSDDCFRDADSIPLENGRHSIAIEADPEQPIYYGYLDGKLVNTSASVNSPSDNSLDAEFQFYMQFSGDAPSSGIEIDNVLLGVPADNTPVIFRTLSDVVSPDQVPASVKVITVDAVIAIAILSYCYLFTTLFNKHLEAGTDWLKAFLAKLFNRKSTNKTERKVNATARKLMVLLNWFIVVITASFIQSWLERGQITFSERISIILPLIIAGLLVSGSQVIFERIFRQKAGLQASESLTETRWIGLFISFISTLFSRLINFQPGLVLGSVEVLSIKPEVEGELEGKRVLFVKVLLFAITLAGWMISPFFKDSTIWIRSLLLTIFLVSLQSLFFELLPLGKLLDGTKLFKWNKLVWLALFLPVTFFTVWVVLNPKGSEIQAIQGDSILAIISVVVFLPIALLLISLLTTRKSRNKQKQKQSTG